MIEINLVEQNDEIQRFNRLERSIIYFSEHVLVPFFEKVRTYWLFSWLEDFADVDSPINNPYIEE